MHDQLIREMLRALDEPVEPDPEFARRLLDELHVELQQFSGSEQSQPRTPRSDAPVYVKEAARPVRRQPRWGPAIAAAVFVAFVGLGAVFVLLQSRGSDPTQPLTEPDPATTISSLPPATTLGEPQEAPVETDVLESVSWQRLYSGGVVGGPGDQFLQAITIGASGLVAVGMECPTICRWAETEADWRAAVWVSDDGTTWSRVPHDESVFGGEGDQMMLDVIATGSGLVAVGIDDHREAAGIQDPPLRYFKPGEYDGAIWISSDGMDWERLPDPDGIFSGPGNQRIEAITAGGPGLVAVGAIDDHAAVWVSGDGRSWTVAAHGAELSGSPRSWMHDVTAGGPGLVAVGTYDNSARARTENESPGASVWISSDGLAWTRVTHSDQIFGGGPPIRNDQGTLEGGPKVIWAVAATKQGLVAGGWAAYGQALWSSSDGLAWEAANSSQTPGGSRDDAITGLISDETRIAAVGWEGPVVDWTVWAPVFGGPEVGSSRQYLADYSVVRDSRTSMQGAIELVDGRLLSVGYVGGRGITPQHAGGAIWIGEWNE